MVRMHHFDFIDLFAGIGGFHHALSQLGGRCVLTCEIDQECKQVYQSSFEDPDPDAFITNIRALTRADIDDEDSTLSDAAIRKRVPEHTVLCAGFPCQPFSKSGAQQGVLDKTRGTLFFDIMAIARARKPKYMVLENVRNLAGPRHTQTWRTIIDSIRELGYRVADEPVILSPHLVPKEHGGAPQVRDRVFILCAHVGRRRGVSLASAPLIRRNYFVDHLGWNPDRWRIADYLENDSSIANVDAYRLRSSDLAWLAAWDSFVSGILAETLPGFPIWVDAFTKRLRIAAGTPDWEANFLRKNFDFYHAHRAFIDTWLDRPFGADGASVRDFPASRQKFEWQARKRHPGREGRTIRDLVCQMRPSGIRVKPATYLPALVAITQTSIVGPEIRGVQQYRSLTPFESAKLQGIPGEVFRKAGVSDKAAYKQLGNAVNVGVARLACRTVMSGAPIDAWQGTALAPELGSPVSERVQG